MTELAIGPVTSEPIAAYAGLPRCCDRAEEPIAGCVAAELPGHLFPGQAESVADRLDEMAEAAGVVQRADVVPIDRGRP